jgi:hypothetical protein
MILILPGGKIRSLMNRKRWLLLFCFIVLGAITLLAGSLHEVHFQPGRSLPTSPTSDNPVIIQAPEVLADTPIWKILLFWLAFVVNLVLFFYLLPPEVRKRIIRQVISFASGVLILLIALRYRILQLPSLNGSPANQSGHPAAGLDSNQTAPIFHPPQVAPWMTYLISLGLFLAFIILAWIAYRWWVRTRARSTGSLHAIADIAQSSLNDLASGRDWGDVIIQSYARMIEVVSSKRGLQRYRAATAREFARRLEFAGLPADAVNRLTRLFESVRYGGGKSDQSDINEAADCLAAILHACGVAQ